SVCRLVFWTTGGGTSPSHSPMGTPTSSDSKGRGKLLLYGRRSLLGFFQEGEA
ncbi:UNVERIFIED_CONTAM: hypothetical protein Sangu_3264100, partial [Sesamum angustifolium]